jgi:sarcosine oxidase
MQFGKDEDGVYEKCDSGHINPRKMVTAQIVGAINQGCDVLRDVVVSLEKNMGTNLFKLTTKSENTILTRKVLLATNTFTKVLKLLKNPPKIIAMPQTVSFGRISEEDAVRLRLISS